MSRVGSAPVRSECLQGEGVTGWAGLSLPLVAAGEQQLLWKCNDGVVLHCWVGLGLTHGWGRGEVTGAGTWCPPAMLVLEEAGGSLNLSGNTGTKKGSFFCWYLLMTSPFLRLPFI